MGNRVDRVALEFRTTVRAADSAAVLSIVKSTGFFSPQETEIARELVLDAVSRGEESGYLFIFAEEAGRVCGYVCYGEIPCTVGSYDLYWIVVDSHRRGCGIGGKLLARAETDIAARGGRLVFVDTSGRPQYDPTRRFYEAHSYTLAARIPDFYAPGDDKVIYSKRL